jgi:Mrp family chromosome partitioning ATPase
LADVRKEINFCKKTNLRILGVVENMSGFVCPNCKCQSDIFPPVTGGAAKMCQDMDVPLLAQIPLEPKLLLACEGGKCFTKEFPDSITSSKFLQIAKSIQ